MLPPKLGGSIFRKEWEEYMSSTKKKGRKKSVDYGKYGYLFVAPFIIVYLIFQLWPLINTFYLSLFNYYTRRQEDFVEWYGFKNFLNVLGISKGEEAFAIHYLGNTLIMWVMNFIPQVLLSLLLAAWLTNTKVKLRGTGAFKVMVYMPNIITAASISVLFNAMFSQFGPITVTLRNWGWIGDNYDFMKSVGASRGLISFMLFWMWYGNTTLLLISGVLGISPTLFEAADIDGATNGQKFRKITIPLLKPILLFVLVTSSIGGMQMYDIPAVFNVSQNGTMMGLPSDKTTTVAMYIMRLYDNSLGKAATVSVLLFIVTLIVSLAFFFSMRERKPKARRYKGGVN